MGNLVALFATCIRGRCERECCATQDAVDKLAAEFGRGRAHFIDLLSRLTNTELNDLVLVAWARSPLKLATGRSRDEWLTLLDAASRE